MYVLRWKQTNIIYWHIYPLLHTMPTCLDVHLLIAQLLKLFLIISLKIKIKRQPYICSWLRRVLPCPRYHNYRVIEWHGGPCSYLFQYITITFFSVLQRRDSSMKAKQFLLLLAPTFPQNINLKCWIVIFAKNVILFNHEGVTWEHWLHEFINISPFLGLVVAHISIWDKCLR